MAQYNLSETEIQFLAAAAQAQAQAAAVSNAANVAAAVSVNHATAHSSRQATPPATPVASLATTPKASASSTRTPTPTQNGVNAQASTTANSLDPQSQSKYQHLLSVIEEMSKDIRPTYAGSKSSAERLKRGIVYARILVRECLLEAEKSART